MITPPRAADVKTQPRTEKEGRFLEYFLGVAYVAFDTLRNICAHLTNVVNDQEVSLGLRIMHRILTNYHTGLAPFVKKYHAKAAAGQEVVGVL
jgi:hypothetical protein